jgi:MFS family permease
VSSVDRVHEGLATWAKRALIAIIVIAALVGAGLLGAAFLPRWWAHRVGAQAGGGFTGGILAGLFYGFVFTALPLAMLVFTFRKRRPWKAWAWMFGFAILLALPNLLTLGIVLGSGKAAHAGERTLDVDAPGFRGATLGAAIAAAIAFLLWEYLRYSRRRARDQVHRLRAELKARDRAGDTSSEPEQH